MAWIRKAEAGGYKATVYTPAGRRTQTFALKGAANAWADELEADIARGEFIDPQLARKTVDYVWETHGKAWRVEKATRKKAISNYKCWVQPRWGSVEVGSILKPHVQTWVNELEEDGVGGWTVIAVKNLLIAILELAVDAGMIRSNPARRVQTLVEPAHEDRVLNVDEQELLLSRFDDMFPDRADAGLFVEGLLETGCRWEELAPVQREAFIVGGKVTKVDIGPVMERDGTVRPYPKGARSRSAAGFRKVGLSPGYWGRLRPVVMATPPGGFVFGPPGGGPLRYDNWHRGVWRPVVMGIPERTLVRAPTGAFDAAAFAVWLDEAKGRAGLGSDRELARAAGFAPSLIQHWRADRYGPTRPSADKLAAALHVPARMVHELAGLVVAAIPAIDLALPLPTPHDLRHTHGSEMADAGIEEHHRMKDMGHADPRSTRRYTHSDEDRRLDAIAEAKERARSNRRRTA